MNERKFLDYPNKKAVIAKEHIDIAELSLLWDKYKIQIPKETREN